jgi:hypothetical protein
MSSPSEEVWLSLYPEIRAKGNLTAAILGECEQLQSVDLTVGRRSIGWAHLELQDRFVQMACGIRERVLSTELWHAGVQYVKAGLTDFKVACALANAWLIDKADLRSLEKNFGQIEILPGAFEFEAGRGVDYAWNRQLNGSNPEVVRAFKEAATRPMLRQLFPFTSHSTVRFSRVTGVPYALDLPYIEALGESVYVGRIASPNTFTPGEVLVRGTIIEAIAAILQVLPQDLKPARNGTAKDIGAGS